MELSLEERERRSEQAKALVASGKFGGPQPGSGRPRKKRAAEIVAEQVSAEGQTIFDRLMEIVRDGTHSNTISAARELMSIEDREAARNEREDEKIDEMHRDQLIALVVGQLKELSERGVIPDIIDGSNLIVEVEDERSSIAGEIPSST